MKHVVAVLLKKSVKWLIKITFYGFIVISITNIPFTLHICNKNSTRLNYAQTLTHDSWNSFNDEKKKCFKSVCTKISNNYQK